MKQLTLILLMLVGYAQAQVVTNQTITKFSRGILVPNPVTAPYVGAGSLWYNPSTNKITYYDLGTSTWKYILSENLAQITYVPLTRTLTAGLGIAAIGDLSADRTIRADSTVLRTVLNSFTKAQTNAQIRSLSTYTLPATDASMYATVGIFPYLTSAATGYPSAGYGTGLKLVRTAGNLLGFLDIHKNNLGSDSTLYFRTGITTSTWSPWMAVATQNQLANKAPLANPVGTGIASWPQFKLTALNTAPASATATGTLGEIRITATYIYICTATNVWVRAALASW